MSRRGRASFIHRKRRFPLEDCGPFFIGRDPDCDLYLPVDGVASRHAIVYPASEGWEIFDFKSGGGLVVNGVPVKRLCLKDGDRIMIGEEPVIFHSEEGGQSSTLRFDLGELGQTGPLDRRLADFTELLIAASHEADLDGALKRLIRFIFEFAGPGAAFVWDLGEGDEEEGKLRFRLPDAEEDRSRRQASLLLPCVRRLVRMDRLLFSGGTPLRPSSWSEGEAKGHFALLPFHCEGMHPQVLLLIWETGGMRCPLSEALLHVSLLGRFLPLWLERFSAQ